MRLVGTGPLVVLLMLCAFSAPGRAGNRVNLHQSTPHEDIPRNRNALFFTASGEVALDTVDAANG